MGVTNTVPFVRVEIDNNNFAFVENVDANTRTYRLTTRLSLPITPTLRETSRTYSAGELIVTFFAGTPNAAEVTVTTLSKYVTGTDTEPLEFDDNDERILVYTLVVDINVSVTDIPSLTSSGYATVARETALDYAANPTEVATPGTLAALRIGVQKLFRIVQDLETFKLDTNQEGTAGHFDRTQLSIVNKGTGNDISLQIQYNGEDVNANPVDFTIGGGSGFDASEYELNLDGDVIQMRDSAAPHTVRWSVDLSSILTMAGLTENQVNALITAHNIATDAHQTLFAGKMNIDASGLTPTQLATVKTNLDIPAAVGAGLDLRADNLADDLSDAEQTAILNKIDASRKIQYITRDPRAQDAKFGSIDGGKAFISTRDDVVSISETHTSDAAVRSVEDSISNIHVSNLAANNQPNVFGYQRSPLEWYVFVNNNINRPQSLTIEDSDDTEALTAIDNAGTATVTFADGSTATMIRVLYQVSDPASARIFLPEQEFDTDSWDGTYAPMRQRSLPEISSADGTWVWQRKSISQKTTLRIFHRESGAWQLRADFSGLFDLDVLGAARAIEPIQRDPRPLVDTTGTINGKHFFTNRPDVASITIPGADGELGTADDVTLTVTDSRMNLRTPAEFQTDIMMWLDDASDSPYRWFILYHRAVENVADEITITDEASGDQAYLERTGSPDPVRVTLISGETIEMVMQEYDDEDEEWTQQANANDHRQFSLSDFTVDGHDIDTGVVAELDLPEKTLAIRTISETNFKAVSHYYNRPASNPFESSKWERLINFEGAAGGIADLADDIARLDEDKLNKDGTDLTPAQLATLQTRLGFAAKLDNTIRNMARGLDLNSTGLSRLLEGVVVRPFAFSEAPTLAGGDRTKNGVLVVNRNDQALGTTGFGRVQLNTEIFDDISGVQGDITRLSNEKLDNSLFGVRSPLHVYPVLGSGTVTGDLSGGYTAGEIVVLSTDASLGSLGRNADNDWVSVEIATGHVGISRNIRATRNGADQTFAGYVGRFGNRLFGEHSDGADYPLRFEINERTTESDGTVSIKTFRYLRNTAAAEAYYNGASGFYKVGYVRDDTESGHPSPGKEFTLNIVETPDSNDYSIESTDLPEVSAPVPTNYFKITAEHDHTPLEWWVRLMISGDPTWFLFWDFTSTSGLDDLIQRVNALTTRVGTVESSVTALNTSKLDRLFGNFPTRVMLTNENFRKFIDIFMGMTAAEKSVLWGLIFNTGTGAETLSLLNRFVHENVSTLTSGDGRYGIVTNEGRTEATWAKVLLASLENADFDNATANTLTAWKVWLDITDGVDHLILEGAGPPTQTVADAGTYYWEYNNLHFENLLAFWRVAIGNTEGGARAPIPREGAATTPMFLNSSLLTSLGGGGGRAPSTPGRNFSVTHSGQELAFSSLERINSNNWILWLDNSRTWEFSDFPETITLTPDDGTSAITLRRNFANTPGFSTVVFDGSTLTGIAQNGYTRTGSVPVSVSRNYTFSSSGGSVTVSGVADTDAVWEKKAHIGPRIFTQNPNDLITHVRIGDPDPKTPTDGGSNFPYGFFSRSDIDGFITADDGSGGHRISDPTPSISAELSGTALDFVIFARFNNGQNDLIVPRTVGRATFPHTITFTPSDGTSAVTYTANNRASGVDSHIDLDGTATESKRVVYNGSALDESKRYSVSSSSDSAFDRSVDATLEIGGVFHTEASQSGTGIEPATTIGIDETNKRTYVSYIDEDDNNFNKWRDDTNVPVGTIEDPNAITIGAQPYKGVDSTEPDHPSYAYLANRHTVSDIDLMRWTLSTGASFVAESGQTYREERKIDAYHSDLGGIPIMFVYSWNRFTRNALLSVITRSDSTTLIPTDVDIKILDEATNIRWTYNATYENRNANYGRLGDGTNNSTIYLFTEVNPSNHRAEVTTYEDFIKVYRPNEPKKFIMTGYFRAVSNHHFSSEEGSGVLMEDSSGDKTLLYNYEGTYETFGHTNAMVVTESEDGPFAIKEFRSSAASASQGFAARFLTHATQAYWMLFPSTFMSGMFRLRQNKVANTDPPTIPAEGTYTNTVTSNWSILSRFSEGGFGLPLAAVIAVNRQDGALVGSDITELSLYVDSLNLGGSHPLWQQFESIDITIGQDTHTLPRQSITYVADSDIAIGQFLYNIDDDTSASPRPAVRINFDLSSAPDIDLRGDTAGLIFNINIDEDLVTWLTEGTTIGVYFEKSTGVITSESVEVPAKTGTTHLQTTSEEVDIKFPSRHVRMETHSTPFLVNNSSSRTIMVDNNIRKYRVDTRHSGGSITFDLNSVDANIGDRFSFMRIGEQWVERFITDDTDDGWVVKSSHGLPVGTRVRASAAIDGVSSGTDMWVGDAEDDRVRLVDALSKVGSSADSDYLDADFSSNVTFTPQTGNMHVDVPGWERVNVRHHGQRIIAEKITANEWFVKAESFGSGQFAYVTGPGSNNYIPHLNNVNGTWVHREGEVEFRFGGTVDRSYDPSIAYDDIVDHHWTLPFGVQVRNFFNNLIPPNTPARNANVDNDDIPLPVGEFFYSEDGVGADVLYFILTVKSDDKDKVLPWGPRGGGQDGQGTMPVLGDHHLNVNHTVAWSVKLPWLDIRKKGY